MSSRSSESRPDPPGLALVGYRGTGKSTVGRLVAERLGRSFVDADMELESRIGMPIARVFAEQGEPVFRDMEERLLAELTTRDGLVLATGGGCVLRASNRRALRRLGFVVWLTADPATLAGRLRDDPAGRPALTDRGLIDEIAEVLQFRTPLYRGVAHEAIETAGRTPEEVADLVYGHYRNHYDLSRSETPPRPYTTSMTVGELIQRLGVFPPELPVFFGSDETGRRVMEPRGLVMNPTNPAEGLALPLVDEGREVPAGYTDSVVIYPQEIEQDKPPRREDRS